MNLLALSSLPPLALAALFGINQDPTGNATGAPGPTSLAASVDNFEPLTGSAAGDNRAWWTTFGDPKLDALLELAVADNLDLAVATSRIKEAEALILQARAPLLPTASIDSTLNMAPTDSLGFGLTAGGGAGQGGNNFPNVYYTASTALNVGLEVDITGRNILNHRARKIDRRASRDDRDMQRIVIQSRAVQAYIDLVAAKARLEVVERQLLASQNLLDITDARFESSQVSALDVLQQRQALASTETLVPQARSQIRLLEHQLAVLTGQDSQSAIASQATLPELPRGPRLGKTENLIRNRPDVRATAHQLESAESRRKSAARGYAPSLRLTGRAGYQALYINDAVSQSFWSLGASLSIPLSTGGLTRSRVHQTRAAKNTAANRLAATTLNALREVEDAAVREQEQQIALDAYSRQQEAATQAFQLATTRYLEGNADFLAVLAAQSGQQRAELNVLAAHHALLSARIALHTALGDS